ncbi:HSPB1-associated protein 1-like [Hondaea fermentalgiana]|uniref:HSPB1-associated protein 1-like n=1 Tax=Hondaea fermentalgiana TaxID=2315210 RepID=A0A2R5GC76_9STRA|nr:HSPB1-associated protein 1-like [Hondaea fermentalgiana]|eukprot:GBG25761.1 HSPB1-associated protein 1-like [Hondaea fermentalgiana]
MLRARGVTGFDRGESLLGGGDSKGKKKAGWKPAVKDVVIAVLVVLLVFSLASSRNGSDANSGSLLQGRDQELGKLGTPDAQQAQLRQSTTDDADEESAGDVNALSSEAELAAEEALNGAYPIQDDEVPNNDEGGAAPEPLSPEELHLEEMAEEEIERAHSGEEHREDWEGIPVESLGGLYIIDGDKYMEAPDIVVPEKPIEPKTLYKKMWPQLEMHEDFYRKHSHKRYIPRIGQPITRQQFHEIFRKTSTPVIIPFKYMRHLGVLTKGWTLKDLRKEFPYEPKIAKKTALMRQEYNQQGLYKGKRDVDFGPALWKLEQDTKIVYGASGTGNRNIPRNMKLPASELAKFNISYPPFLPSSEFQPPTMWMGTTSADTVSAFHVQGTKRWFIAPPTDSRKLWPNACVGKHTALCWSPLKFPFRKNLTPKERAMKEKLEYIDVDVNAGEMLYLPAGWWHMISNRGPTIM